MPFRPSPFRATVALSIGGADVTIERNVEYRYSDLFAGEKRMELQVVPPFAVRVSPEIAVIPAEGDRRTAAAADRAGAGSRTRKIAVTVSNNQKGPLTATRCRCAFRPAGSRRPRPLRSTFERQDEAGDGDVRGDAGRRASGGRVHRRSDGDGPAARPRLECGLRHRRIPAHPSPARHRAGAGAGQGHRRHHRARPARRVHHGGRRRDAGRHRAARRRSST